MWKWVSASALFVLCACWAPSAMAFQATVQCAFGAWVEVEEDCQFFVHYKRDGGDTDPRLASVLAPAGERTRSVALVVAVSAYPKLVPPQQLVAAKSDRDNLVQFLTNDQQFDEVIVLENEAATKERIDAFLMGYVPQAGLNVQGRARFLFAYTGHGISERAGSAPSFLLADARAMDDERAMYSMADLSSRIQNVSRNYFHVLSLINACNGGNFFGGGIGGGNPNVTDQRGSYGVTAGDAKNAVASIDPTRGSVFFDAIIRGVRSGTLDKYNSFYSAESGELLQQGGITRLLPLFTHLTDEIENLNRKRLPFNGGTLVLPPPWIGAVEMPNSRALGGFFFLSPYQLDGISTPIVGVGPSVQHGRTDIVVFGAPEEYPFRGIDVSHHEGRIAWHVVQSEHDFDFVYIRLRGWPGRDAMFKTNWTNVKEQTRADRGAYVVFDYCLPPWEQMNAIRLGLPDGNAGELPFAIALQLPDGVNLNQARCLEVLGPARTRVRILELGTLLQRHYGKVPLIRAARYTLERLEMAAEPRFLEFMLWLDLYQDSRPSSADIQRAGRNPWTIWQYTAFMPVEGIGPNVDSNVFFGTSEDYDLFKKGEGNIARSAMAPVS